MTLNIERPCVRVDILRDGRAAGQLTLYPEDTAFLQRFYELGGLLAARQAALPAGAGPEEALAALEELAAGVRADIDGVFGPGTAEMVFGPAGCSPAALEQFFAGVAAALEESRRSLLEAYLPGPAAGGGAAPA